MIVAFGASGRIGRLVVARLVEAGHAVRAVSRDPARARGVLPAEVEVVEGDADAPATLARALLGAERAFILSGIGSRLAEQQLAMVEAAAAAGATRIVKLSGSSWTMPPGAATAVGRAHATVDERLRSLAIPTTTVRPNAVTQSFFGRAKADAIAQGAFSLPIGHAAISTVDLHDVVDVLVHALVAPNAARAGLLVHSITGPAAVSGAQVAALLARQLDRAVGYRAVSIESVIEREQARGASRFLLDHLTEVYRLIASGAAAEVTTTIAATLGRAPRPVDGFLKE